MVRFCGLLATDVMVAESPGITVLGFAEQEMVGGSKAMDAELCGAAGLLAGANALETWPVTV